jgi:hypothetical protein
MGHLSLERRNGDGRGEVFKRRFTDAHSNIILINI